MAQKIQAEMSTDVALNTLKASQSLKSLNAVISSTKNAWKSQEVALKSTGEYLKAAEVRYKGLGDSIKAQETKIESLREKQKGLDVTTKDGAASYLKYQKNIDSATTQLKSMEAQQARAKTSLEYQKSGLASLQTEYKQITTVSNSYVERLKAEGKQQEANKAQMTGYKDSISNLNKQLSAQEKELSRIATASGKDSDAWRTQKVRVDETATALAKTKTSMTELDSAMKKANPSVFTRIKTAIKGTNKEADKTPSLFKKIVAGGLVTNALSNGFSTVTSAIKSTLKSGLELNEAGEKLNDTWKNMGKSANDITILGSQLGYLRSQTGATGLEVNTLQKTVDTMTKGVTDKTVVISAGIAGIATASHIGGAGMDALAKSLTRVTSSGRITNSGLVRLEKQAPTLGAQLAKAAGVSQSAFAQMVDKGKISSDDFQKLLYKIGTTSGDTFKAYGKTAEGAMAQISGGWTTLKGKMAAPLLEVKNSGMSSLSSLITSPILQAAATKLGQSIATAAGYAQKGLEYINKHKKDVTGISSDLFQIGKIIGDTVWTVFKQMLSDIAQMFGTTTKNSKALKDPLGTVHDILDKMVKNKSAIQTFTKTLLALFAVKKATSFAFAIGQVATQLGKLGSTKLGTSVTSGVSKLLSGQSLGGVGQSVKSAGGVSALSTAGKVATGAAGLGIAVDAGTSIAKAFTDKKRSAKYTDAGKGIGAAIGGGIGLYFGGPLGATLGATIGKLVGGWGGKAAKKFMDGWSSKKKPAGNWIATLGWDAKKVLTPVTNGIKSLWKSLSPITKQISTLFKTMWKIITTATSNAWHTIKPVVKTLGRFIELTFKSVSKVVKPLWSGLWKTVGTVLKAAWVLIKAVLKSGLKVINDLLKVYLNLMKGNWKGVWNSIKSLVKDVWTGIKSIVSAGVKGIYNVIKTVLGSIKSVWHGMWNGLKTFFGGIWDGMKSSARKGMRGVVSIINAAIKGINWVWNKFTGHSALKTIKLATGGVVGASQRVMLNDGAGSHWKELYQTPTGQLGMLQKRNAVTMLPVGTRVYNGEETHSIMNAAGIEHYATGGIVGSITNLFKSGWDKAKEVASWLKNPVKNVSKMLTSAVYGMSASTSMFTNLGKGIVSKLVSSVAAWFKKSLKKISDSLDGGGSEGAPSGSGIKRWTSQVKKALAANGLSTSTAMVNKVLRQIQTESGGNEKAVQGNIGDINNLTGDLAKGLMQTISTTFAANAFPGHKNIFNGYDNLLAALRYAKNRYGSSLSYLGHGHGYANGGFVNGAAYRLTGEAGPEMIVPLSASKASRAWQLLGQAVQTINKDQASPAQLQTGADNSDIIAAINALGVLLTKLSFNVQIGDDQFYPTVAPKIKQYNDRQNSFRAIWQD